MRRRAGRPGRVGLPAARGRLGTTGGALCRGFDPEGLAAALERLGRHAPLRDAIERFWREPSHREARSWTDHRDINRVMLATSLCPDGFLRLSNGVFDTH
ncbi:MAG TPA: hypothetical protein VK852_12350 [Desulfobacterales bacterium]|nr:hypothetical protein [Desulfobacterales bacterium]